MAGFIYILSNRSFVSGRIKIGKSDRDPSEHRIFELNTTGVPEPFELEYYALVENHHAVERQLHRTFDEHRANKNREFFDVSITAVVSEVQKNCVILFERNHAQGAEALQSALPMKVEQSPRLTEVTYVRAGANASHSAIAGEQEQQGASETVREDYADQPPDGMVFVLIGLVGLSFAPVTLMSLFVESYRLETFLVGSTLAFVGYLFFRAGRHRNLERERWQEATKPLLNQAR